VATVPEAAAIAFRMPGAVANEADVGHYSIPAAIGHAAAVAAASVPTVAGPIMIEADLREHSIACVHHAAAIAAIPFVRAAITGAITSEENINKEYVATVI